MTRCPGETREVRCLPYEFFKTRIPEKAKELDPFHEKMIQLTLFALLASNNHIHRWFSERMDLPDKPKESDYGYFLLCHKILPIVESLDPGQAVDLLKEASIEVLLNNRTVMSQTRRRAAEFLGIDLAAEWRITRDYLEKKTKGEIVSIMNRFKILDRPEAWEFAKGNYCLKLKSAVGRLKKEQMMAIILDSGIDLAGIIPAEILHDSTPAWGALSNEGSSGSVKKSPDEKDGIELRSIAGEGEGHAGDIGYGQSDAGYTVDPEEEIMDAV